MEKEETNKTRKIPVFTAISTACFVVSLFSPMIFVTIPVIITLIFSIIAFFVKEKPRFLSPAIAVASILLLFSVSSHLNDIKSSIDRPTSAGNLNAATLENFSWSIDPAFAGKGTVKWKFSVHNNSNKSISSVKVEFTSYDKNHNLLASTFTYLNAIPPGETRSEESYADYYHTEETANAVISEVRFSGE